jgi:hypothetical protein
MKQKLLNELRDIENQLSPENLCCDGEAPREWVEKRYKSLSKERARIIKQLGYNPTFNELYSIH